MKRKLLIVGLFLLISQIIFSQNLTISGGNDHSVMICSKGLVYAWGDNKDETLGLNNLLGLTGTDATSAYVTSPKPVTMPTGVTFNQVDGGSGAFNIALSCEGIVYEWGENSKLQLGQGNSGPTSLSVPTPVVKGQTSGSTVTGMTAYLGNVTFVSASTSSSYAIMNDGRVVAWGSNAYKQLGNPSITAASYGEPVYVKKGNASGGVAGDLTDVIFIDAGDEQVLFLVDDGVKGDGIGTVYSLGGSAFNNADLVLGRDVGATTPAGLAYPVLREDGSPLTNIKMVSAGDSHGIAVDAITGLVYSWGNDGWNCLTGTSMPNPITNGNRARKVISGEYKTISGNDYLTNIRQVSGGRGYTVAVTMDGYAISWGGNENNGGNLGSGSAAQNSCTTGPQLLRYNTAGNPIVNDAVSVSDGDNFGFLINKANKFFAWGLNDRGQLGIGSIANQNYVVDMTTNIPCSIPDPCPKADIAPTFTICENQSFTINSGFTVPTGKSADYVFRWYTGTSSTGPWTVTAQTTTTFVVNKAGFYKVEIEYIGNNVACNVCGVSTDVFEVKYYVKPFDDPGTNQYCGTCATPHVTGTGTFAWFASNSSTAELARSTDAGDADKCIPLTSMTSLGNDAYQVFVEDVSSVDATFATLTELSAAGLRNGQYGYEVKKGATDDKSVLYFTISREVKLMSVKFRQPAYGATVVDVTITGGTLASPAHVVGTSVPGAGGAWTTATVDFTTIAAGGLILGPGNYTIAYTGSSGGIASFENPGINPYPVDFGGGLLTFNKSGLTQGNHPNAFNEWFDWRIVAGSNYPCKRIPVTITKKAVCCKEPALPTISNDNGLQLCPGGSTTLSTNSQASNSWEYLWYRGDGTGTPEAGYPKAAISDSYVLSHGYTGLMTVLVRDKAEPTEQSCWKKAQVTVTSNSAPSYTIATDAAYCSNATAPGVVVTLTGSSPFSFTANDGTSNLTPVTNLTASSYTITPTGIAAGSSKTYTLTAFADSKCPGTPDATQKATITSVLQPNYTWASTNVLSYCAGASTPTLSVETTTPCSGCTFDWKKNSQTVGTTASISNPITAAGTFNLTVSNASSGITCSQSLTPITVTMNAKPTYAISGTGDYCEGDVIPAPVITFNSGKAPYNFTYSHPTGSQTSSAGTSTSANPVTYTIPGTVNEGVYQLSSLTDANGCVGDITSQEAIINVDPIPTVTPGLPRKFCRGSVTNVDLTTLFTFNPASGTAVYSINGIQITGSLFTNTNTPGRYVVSVEYSVGNCSANSSDTVVVWANPSVAISPDPATVCSDANLQLSTTVTGGTGTITYLWADASSGLSSTSISNPVYRKSVTTNSSYPISVTVTDGNGCKGTDNISIDVVALPTATLNAVPTSICPGETSTITATVNPSGGTGTWSGTGVTRTDETTATFTSTTANTYTISYKYVSPASANYCEMTPAVTTTVTVKAKPSAPTVVDLAYCVNSTASALTATGSGLLWYNSATGGTGSATAPTPITTTPGSTSYWVSQTVDGCESDRSELVVTINTNLSPVILATPGFEVCEKTAINLSLGGGTFNSQTWSGTAAAQLNNTTVSTPTFLSTATANTYILTVNVTDTKGCTGTVTDTIKVNPIPSATLDALDKDDCADVTTPELITATISPNGVVGTGTWVGDGTTKVTETTANFTPSVATAGSHQIKYSFISDKGCSATPVTIDMTVYSMPNISISPSKVDVCKSGNNSSVVTINTVGVTGGVTLYSSATGTGINTSNGSIDPSIVPVGTHQINLDYTDENGCTDNATTSVTIHALPTVTFNAIDPTMCIYEGAVTLNVSPVAVAPATGVFSGAVTTNSFNPSIVGTGAKNITYSYRDEFGCENVANTTITVYEIPVPSVVNDPKTVVVDVTNNLTDDTDIEAAGTYNLEWMDQTCATVDATGAIYVTGITASDIGALEQTKSFTFKVRQTDPSNGCSSNCVDATLILSRCPALTPSAADAYYCVGTSNALTVTATPQMTQAALDRIDWFSSSNTTLTPIANNTTTYTDNAMSKTVAGVSSVFVAQYNNQFTCYSAAKEVKINVVDTPSVTVTVPTDVCSVNGNVSIAVNPGGGVLTGDDAGLDGAAMIWNPTQSGVHAPSKTLHYSYVVSKLQLDNTTTCTSTKNGSIVAHATEKLLAENKSWLISQVDLIPNNFMTATLSGSGVTIKWYADAQKQVLLVTGPTYTPDRDALKAEIPVGATSFSKKYYVTQTDNFGCESEPTEVELLLLNCPFKAPETVSVEECQNDVLGAISANLPSTTTVPADEWKWYQADQTTAIVNANNTYDHGVSNSVAGVTTYYVSYIATEPVSGKPCESPKSPVTVTVNPLPVITFTETKTVLCYDQGDEAIDVTVNNNGNGMLSENWTLNGATNGISAGIMDPTFNDETSGTYPIVYTYTDGNNCSNSKTYTIDVQYSPVLTAVNHVSMTIDDLPVIVSATGQLASASTNWYNTSNSTPSVYTGNSFTTPEDGSVEGNGTYYASQTVRGCESARIPVQWTVVDCPFNPPTVTGIEVCQNATLQPLTAALPAGSTYTVDQWKWYTNDDKTGDLANDSPTLNHNVDASVAGSTTFYVSYIATETISSKQCETALTPVTIKINKNPDPVITTNADICWDASSIALTGTENKGLHGSGVFTVGSSTSPVTSITLSNVTSDQSYDVTYTWISSATEGSCTTAVNKTINVHYIEPPATTGTSKVIGVQEAYPQVEATVTGTSVEWYDDLRTQMLGTNAIYVYPTTEPASATCFTYYARQYDAFGCKSDFAEEQLCFTDCRAVSPDVPQISVCGYSPAPTFTFTKHPTSTTNGAYSYKVYTTTGTLLATVPSNPGTWVVNPYNNIDGVYQFQISEFDEIDQCESKPKKTFSVRVTSTLPPSLGNPALPLCEDDSELTGGRTISIDALSVLNPDSVLWYPDGTPTGAGQSVNTSIGVGTSFIAPQVTSGTYTYYVSQTNRCHSVKIPVVFTIKPKPTPPILTGNFSCEGSTFTPLKADANSTNVKWYKTVGGNSLLSSIPNEYTPNASNTSVGENTFYATQTNSDGCTSDHNNVVYTVREKPPVPTIVIPQSVCEYETTIGNFTISNQSTGATVEWEYNGAKTTGDSYQIPLTTPFIGGNYPVSAIQVLNTCSSDVQTETFIIHQRPTKPTISNINPLLCNDNQLSVKTISTSGFMVKWYLVNPSIDSTATPVATGTTYKPDNVKRPNTANTTETTEIWATRIDPNTNCVSLPSVTEVKVISLPEKPVILNPENLVCSNEKYSAQTLVAKSPVASLFKWYLSSTNEEITIGLSGGNNSALYPDISKLVDGKTLSYYVKVQDVNGCISSDSAVGNFTVSRSFKTLNLSDTTTYCLSPGSMKLYKFFTTANDLRWTVTKEGDTTVMRYNDWSSELTFEPENEGNYLISFYQKYIFDNQNGMVRECYFPPIFMNQRVLTIPTPMLSGDDKICENTTKVDYLLNPTDSSHTFSWTVTGNRPMYSVSDKNSDFGKYIDWSEPGYDTLVVSEDNGVCIGYDTLIIGVSPHAVPQFAHELPAAGTKVVFTNTTEKPVINDGGVSDTVQFNYFLWNFGREDDVTNFKETGGHYDSVAVIDSFILNKVSNLPVPISQKYKYGYYDITLTSYNDYCVDKAVYEIFVDLQEGFYIPNAFAPDNASKGVRIFKPLGFNIEKMQVWVYDNWGNLLWYTDKLKDGQPLEGWDGTYNNEILKSDAYIWKAKVIFMDGSEWEGQSFQDGPPRLFGPLMLVR